MPQSNHGHNDTALKNVGILGAGQIVRQLQFLREQGVPDAKVAAAAR